MKPRRARGTAATASASGAHIRAFGRGHLTRARARATQPPAPGSEGGFRALRGGSCQPCGPRNRRALAGRCARDRLVSRGQGAAPGRRRTARCSQQGAAKGTARTFDRLRAHIGLCGAEHQNGKASVRPWLPDFDVHDARKAGGALRAPWSRYPAGVLPPRRSSRTARRAAPLRRARRGTVGAVAAFLQ
jgi:hypothetical protein